MNDCTECFYRFQEHDAFPCNTCNKYSHYIHKDIFAETQPSMAWKTVVNSLSGLSKEDLPVPLTQQDYNTVNKPRHYMLFNEDEVIYFESKGIEARDVIEKLVYKVKMSAEPDWADNPLFDSDYAQLMQYLMRFMDKNGVEDLKKSRWYLDKLIEAYDAG